MRDSASEVRRAECPAKFACDSIPDCTVVVCDAAVAASERTSAGRGVGRVLEDHRARVGPRVLRELRREPGHLGVEQRAHPRGDQRRRLRHRAAQRVERQRQHARVEVAVGQRDAVGREHQRVLARDVELDLEHAREPLERLVERALDLRHAAEHERVVDRAPGGAHARLGDAEQLAQAPRDLDLPVVRARRVHARVEHREVGVRGVVGERGDAERGVEQPARVVEDERRLADADGVGAHEREAVARPVVDRLEAGRGERLGGGHDVVADPAVALAAERRRRSRRAP